MEPFIIFSLIRISAASIIFKWPFFGILLSALLDGYDWDFLHTSRGFNYETYQIWDKAMDTAYLTVALLTIGNWKDRFAKKIAIFLYTFRINGTILYFIFQIKPFLFFFPNIFENFFIWYLIFIKISKNPTVSKSRLVWLVVILCISIPKIIHEYVMHVRNVQLWYLFDFNFIDKTSEVLRQYMNWMGWGSIFYIIPFFIAFSTAAKFRK